MLIFHWFNGAQGQNRTADTWIFNPVLRPRNQWVKQAQLGKPATLIQGDTAEMENFLFHARSRPYRPGLPTCHSPCRRREDTWAISGTSLQSRSASSAIANGWPSTAPSRRRPRPSAVKAAERPFTKRPSTPAMWTPGSHVSSGARPVCLQKSRPRAGYRPLTTPTANACLTKGQVHSLGHQAGGLHEHP